MSPILHNGNKLELVPGQTIFDYADSLKIRVPTSCGRSGTCHECIVEIKRGIEALTSPSTSEQFLQDKYRLACQATVVNPHALIEFALLRRQPKILADSVRRQVPLEPMVKRHGDNVHFLDQHIDKYRGNIFGLSIDAGTTTIVLNLIDLESGIIAHTSSFENPQRFGGSDIMHRISYDRGQFHGELQQVMLSAINFEIGEITRELKIHRRLIYDVVVVGNATMRDIFFGLDVQSIGEKPYKSITETETAQGDRQTTSINMKAKDIGLRVFPQTNVYSGPLIGSHIGSDIVADLLAIGMDEEENIVTLIDIGTNTEVVVGNRHRMLAASCPAGPAFEGGEISYGMPGYDGAVESVSIINGSVDYKTIGNLQPQGICGSGLVDLIAELRRTRMMNELGVFADGSNKFEFVPDKEMFVSRSDISALAQAKSANYSGQWIVLRKYGVPLNQITQLYLAGGFANYVNVKNAVDIGFIAPFPHEKVVKVGNASLEGASIMLTSRTMRQIAEDLVSRIEHVELETTSDFFEIFVEGCMFKPMATEFA